MLKLRYLFDNPGLARMLLENWEYDADSLDLFREFRISSNAIYPFRLGGEVRFLRFRPPAEKPPGSLAAELEFLAYLRAAGYPAPEAAPARSGETMLVKSTPWGEYEACVFRRVGGCQLTECSQADETLLSCGAALGHLHALSSVYRPAGRRHWTHADALDWMQGTLCETGSGAAALDELRLLRAGLSALPVHGGVYGLVHYDFETDNVFFDAQTGLCSVIDFDDAMYHWYGMDIVRALDNLKEESGAQDGERVETLFMRGYRSRYAPGAHLAAHAALFRRFERLFRHVRVLRSLSEGWDNEPPWMSELRARLESLLKQDARGFGIPIPAPFAAGGTEIL